MLVEFKFSNFRSFKEETIFSMEPLSQNGTNPNAIDTGLKKIPQLYRTAGIFGANASGKSNVLKAVELLKIFVGRSWKNDINKKIYTDFYKLDTAENLKETAMEVSYLVEGILYNYGIKFNSEKFTAEYLYITDISPQGTGYKNRIFDTTKESFGKTSGIKQSWIDEHAQNRLFLSEIINKKCEVPEVQIIYDEIVKKTDIINNSLSDSFSVNMLQNEHKKDLLDLIRKADLGMTNLEVEEVNIEKMQDIINKTDKLDDARKDILQKILQINNKKVIEIKSYHTTEDGQKQKFDFADDESKGTQIFFALTAPVLDTIRAGKVLFIDELDASLHPYLVQYLVSFFNNPEINTKGAQLIFTSHAHYLMDGKHLSRDQIWFTSKELNNGFYSDLYSLSDFKKITRRNISFYDAYMNGIYGAVPFLERNNG